MALGSWRRRIDWKPGGESTPRARLVPTTGEWSRLAGLVADLADDPSEEATDRFLRDAVEFARQHLGIERCGIYRLNAARMMMVGSWGTGAQGETVDEHDLAYAFGDVDRQVFDRAQAGVLWTVFDDCPLIAQVEGETRVIGRGWVGCTAIRGPRAPLGTLFNDSAMTGSPVNEATQSRAAILCGVLGQVLAHRRQPARADGGQAGADHPLVQRVTDLLSDDPTLSCAALARQLRVSAGRLARTFKSEARVSVVEHRNELRLARFPGARRRIGAESGRRGDRRRLRQLRAVSSRIFRPIRPPAPGVPARAGRDAEAPRDRRGFCGRRRPFGNAAKLARRRPVRRRTVEAAHPGASGPAAVGGNRISLRNVSPNREIEPNRFA